MTGVSFRPATPERWDDVVQVIGSCANGRNCWCAYWYLPNADYKARWGSANREVLEQLVKDGEEPGLLAYDNGQPAGWVSVAPRTKFDRLNRSKNFAPLDDVPVWAVNCFIVPSRFRRQGMLSKLAGGAADFAFAKGAPGVEGYPVDPGEKTSANDLYLGSVHAFEAAGYREVARPLPRRAIMRRMRA
jgi:hypothetical protein